jgi:pentose-5-phosphate-3-epimerase
MSASPEENKKRKTIDPCIVTMELQQISDAKNRIPTDIHAAFIKLLDVLEEEANAEAARLAVESEKNKRKYAAIKAYREMYTKSE